MTSTTLMIFQAVLAVIVIFLVLIQFGKGAEAGLMSTAGENSMSGATKGNILTRITTVVVAIFFINCILLARIEGKKNTHSLMDVEAPIQRPLNSDAQTASATKTGPTPSVAPTTSPTATAVATK